MPDSIVQFRDAGVVGISHEDFTAPGSGARKGVSKPYLIVPIKYSLIIFYKPIKIVCSRVRWINKKEIALSGRLYSFLKIAILYSSDRKKFGNGRKIIIGRHDRSLGAYWNVKIAFKIFSIQTIPTGTI